MDAVFETLQEKSVRELTMEGIAERANIGKPTLYKWWPTKSALVFAVLQERLAAPPEPLADAGAEEAVRARMRRLVRAFNGMLGRVLADLIAEGQSDAAVLRELYDDHLKLRRDEVVAEVELGKQRGEFAAELDAELLVETLFGPIYYRLLIKSAPLTETYVDRLLAQVLHGHRSAPAPRSSKRRRAAATTKPT